MTAAVPTLALERRLELFRAAAEKFFAGSAWLSGATGVPGAVLAGAAGLTLLVLDQARARFETILDRPIGVADAAYSVPAPLEVVDWFRVNAEFPELLLQFEREVMQADWRALQPAHRILYDVLIFRDPALRGAFAAELARRDFRAIVEHFPAVRAALDELVKRPATRSALKAWFEILTGQGPEADDPAVRATFDAHWQSLLATLTGAVT